ncbi:dehydroascorbate reductase 2 [Tanacetum coccineum]
MPKINKSSPSTGEAIMICIDTSDWMQNKESPRFKQQADAIRFYCTQKFMSNPHTVVGISGMGEGCLTNLITPTRNIALIMSSLYDAKISDDLLILDGVLYAHQVWFGCRGEELGVHLPKRMAVFAGGPIYYEKDDMKEFGQAFKEKNVACDAISFGHPARNKKELFDTLIAAADNYGNCNLVHVQPNSTVLAALFSSQIFQSGGGGSASQESYSVAALSLSRSLITPHVGEQESYSVAALALSRSLSVQQQSLKLNAKAAASYPDSVNPVKIAAWSQSSLDLKLDNANPNWETVTLDQKIDEWSQSSLDLKLDANPNWQPETLDQKIERVKRELQSLIQQKNQQVAC